MKNFLIRLVNFPFTLTFFLLTSISYVLGVNGKARQEEIFYKWDYKDLLDMILGNDE